MLLCMLLHDPSAFISRAIIYNYDLPIILGGQGSQLCENGGNAVNFVVQRNYDCNTWCDLARATHTQTSGSEPQH